MVRSILTVFILALIAQSSPAAIDPRPDVLGVYFDDGGNLTCRDDLVPAAPFSVWFVYTNPSVPAILGFEAGFHTTGAFPRLAINPPCMIVWPVEPELDNLYFACSEPLLTGPATPVFRIDYLYLGVEPLESVFYLEKARDSALPGNNPYVILPGGAALEVQAGMPAYTTAFCGVSNEKRDWGAVKSLYR